MHNVHQTAEGARSSRKSFARWSSAGCFRGWFFSLWDKWANGERRAPVFFAASSLFLSVGQLVSGVATIHFVAPRDLGLWTSTNLALTYAFFALAGVQNGLSRELPFHLGANNADAAQRLAATSLLYTLGACVLAVLAGIATSVFLFGKHADSRLLYCVASVTLLVSFKFYQNYLFVTFRSKNSFIDLATVQAWTAVLTFVALPLLFLGFHGMVIRAVFLGATGLYWMHRKRPMSISPSWRTDSFFLLLKTGIPIFAMDYLANCAGTLDKVALLRFGGTERVGLYALAVSVFSAFQVIPQSIAHYIYPRMSHHYGRTNNPRILWGMAWKTSVMVVGSMIPVAVAGYWLLPVAVRAWFPKYSAGTHAAQIALFTAVAYGSATGANALLSLKAWSHLIAYQLSFAGLQAVGAFTGARLLTSPLEGVAYGMLTANLIAAVLSLAITFSATHRKAQKPKEILTGIASFIAHGPDLKPDATVE